MHGMTCAVGDHLPQELLPQERQITNQVKDFVTDEFV